MSAVGSLGIDLHSIILYVINFGIIFFFLLGFGIMMSSMKDNSSELDIINK